MQAIHNSKIETKKERRYLKSLYFFLFLAFGSIQPFAMAFYKRILTTPDGDPDMLLIGTIVTLSPIVAFFANLSIGILSDKFGLSKKLVSILAFMGAGFALFLGIWGGYSGLDISYFALLFIAAVLAYGFVIASLGPLVDSETLHYLNKYSDRKKFGNFRIWGTYGWAISALVVGIVLTLVGLYVGDTGSGNYFRIIYFFAAAVMLCLAIFGIKARPVVEKKPKFSYKQILSDTLYLRFLVFIFLQGIIIAASLEMYFAFFWSEMLAGPLQIGMIYAFWTIPEMWVMKNSDKLLQKFGRRKILLSGILLFSFQLFLFSTFTPDMPFILKFLPAMLYGASFALNFLGIINYLDTFAPANMKATYLTTMYITRGVFAAVVGGALGGVVIYNFGTSALMLGGAGAMLFMAVFFVVFVKSPREG